jgi:phage host-nuclease inhibitor protein Gam
MKKTTVRRAQLPMPKDMDEVNGLVAEVGDLDGKLLKEKARLDRQLAKVRQEAKDRTDKLKTDRSDTVKRITKYAKKHREQILPGEKKSVELSAGTIGWRFGPCKAAVEGDDESLIAWLEANEFPQYLRYGVEVNREQLLEDRPDFIPGVQFEQKEFFFIEPGSESSRIEPNTVVTMVRTA